MPDTSEESAVLNLDSGSTLAGIYHALKLYAQTVPDTAVAQVTFEQQPDAERVGRWKATARLRCLGGLERKAAPEAGDDFLANVEPTLVHEQRWSAHGLGFAGAVEELRDLVEEHLQSLITQRQQDLQAAGEALRVLRNPGELDNMWSLQDNPQDEHAVDPAQ